MHEINRRISFNDEAGTACGPVNFATIDAEIAIQDGTETVYVFGEWVSEAYDEIHCMAVRESMFDVCARLKNNAEDIDELAAEREHIEAGRITDDEKYRNFYTEITNMITKEMEAHGYKPDFDD